MCDLQHPIKSVVIEKRFCGPPRSANGGYVCGLLAAHIDGGAEITLLAPPPLGQRLDIVAGKHGVELRNEGATLATARGVSIDVPKIPSVSFREAQEAVRRSPYEEGRHPLPTCFVCGPRAWTAMVCASSRVICRTIHATSR